MGLRNNFKKTVRIILEKIGLLEWVLQLYALRRSNRFQKEGGSEKYWEKRYAGGGNSGAGSYNRLAQFKADTINEFFDEHKDIHTCIEWGCGDGNQLLLINYLMYVGIDVSSTIIEKNKVKFSEDKTKKFYESNEFLANHKGEQYDMALSLDVIYHLVEDEVFEKYMSNLFAYSKKYICIYSSNVERPYNGSHMRERFFTNWIEKNKPEWKLIKFVKQKYPYDPKVNDVNSSISDFYFYELLRQP